jgi:hypothetical protein
VAFLCGERGEERDDGLGVGAADEVDGVEEGFGGGEGEGFVEGWFGEEGAGRMLVSGEMCLCVQSGVNGRKTASNVTDTCLSGINQDRIKHSIWIMWQRTSWETKRK